MNVSITKDSDSQACIHLFETKNKIFYVLIRPSRIFHLWLFDRVINSGIEIFRSCQFRLITFIQLVHVSVMLSKERKKSLLPVVCILERWLISLMLKISYFSPTAKLSIVPHMKWNHAEARYRTTTKRPFIGIINPLQETLSQFQIGVGWGDSLCVDPLNPVTPGKNCGLCVGATRALHGPESWAQARPKNVTRSPGPARPKL